MKSYYILLGAAAFMALNGITSAQAQSYATSDARLLNDANQMEARNSNPLRRNAQTTAMQSRSVRTEPTMRQNTNAYDDFTGPYIGGDVGYAFTDDVDGWNG